MTRLTPLLLLTLLWVPIFARAETTTISSPSDAVKLNVDVDGVVGYSLEYNGAKVLETSRLGLIFRDARPFDSLKLIDKTIRQIDKTWDQPLGKRSKYVDRCVEATFMFQEENESARKIGVKFRVYDEGLAFRYVLPEDSGLTDESGEFCVESESTEFAFSKDYDAWASFYRTYNTSQEEIFQHKKLSDVKPDSFVGIPLILCADSFAVALTEADLLDWSGAQFATAQDNPTTVAVRLTPRKDGRGAVVRKTPAASPWRVVILGKNPIDLINNSTIVQNLATPCLLEDVSWIEPGNASWDWWAPKSTRVMSNEAFYKFIDFSASMGWKYTLIDAGWSRRTNYGYDVNDATVFADNVDIPKCVEYAKEKGVKLLVWFHWTDLDKAGVRETLKRVAEWGVAGVKIDFMDSHAQEMVEWTTETCKIAAEYKLLVDYHGMYKPTGMERTYPNQITREGVRGNEYNRWSKQTATHTVTLPFTRCMLGPADYTPGGFRNEHSDSFKSLDKFEDKTETCRVVGTRARELALCMIYDSPLRCLCDLPQFYVDQPGVEYLRDLPSVWDETTALDGKIGEFITLARRSGDRWFVSGITNEEARNVGVCFDFLDENVEYDATIYADAPESETDACAVKIEQKTLQKGDVETFELVRDGGFNLVLTPKARR